MSTPHAHALEEPRIEEEPPDAIFVHAASGASYQIERKDGQLWHREFYRDGDSEIAVTEYPVKWRIGSGHHSRSYLIDIDGYCFESPLTWYVSQEAWGMSPGFDEPEHEGFSRAAHLGCVECHSGRVEAIGKSSNRLNIIETSIGCENCHGPGSLHVQERTAGHAVQAEFDDTIVNPRKISRRLNEDICARCHLRGAGWALVRGRNLSGFRPGLPLSDFRVDFVQKQSSGEMAVVGHFEQMHASRCYTESETLTCTTCHNPHHSPAPGDKVDYYRQKCLECHGPDSSMCALPQEQRQQQNPLDDCVSCHMPQSETDIQHFTFTHHRIGIPREPRQHKVHTTELIPFGDVSRLTTLDLQRCLGLALRRAAKDLEPALRQRANQQALELLNEVYREGLRDAAVLGELAILYWTQSDPVCLDFAQQALAAPDCSNETRIETLIVVGDTQLQRGSFAEAEQAFAELTEVRLRSTDWQMLGVARSLQNKRTDAIAAFQRALELKPGSIDLHTLLADELEKVGQKKLSSEHREMADRLVKIRESASKRE